MKIRKQNVLFMYNFNESPKEFAFNMGLIYGLNYSIQSLWQTKQGQLVYTPVWFFQWGAWLTPAVKIPPSVTSICCMQNVSQSKANSRVLHKEVVTRPLFLTLVKTKIPVLDYENGSKRWIV